MFGLGPLELVIVLAIVLLLFGSRVPKLARSLGQARREFEEGSREGPDDAVEDRDERPARNRKAGGAGG